MILTVERIEQIRHHLDAFSAISTSMPLLLAAMDRSCNLDGSQGISASSPRPQLANLLQYRVR
jgi:hypothetical protein